ncbi:MAG: HEPN domain-containing protein [Oligoflexia bacterium]|nr:HEPN domain-containing protein [Oligoflexia bacterium]
MSKSSTAGAWFKKANQDLKVIKFLLDGADSDVLESCAFHCQQSIEKSIKGFLVHNLIRSKKIHDLRPLAEKAVSIDESLDFIILNKTLLDKITDFAVAYRYPDAVPELPPLTKSEVLDARDLAQKCFNELSKRCHE